MMNVGGSLPRYAIDRVLELFLRTITPLLLICNKTSLALLTSCLGRASSDACIDLIAQLVVCEDMTSKKNISV